MNKKDREWLQQKRMALEQRKAQLLSALDQVVAQIAIVDEITTKDKPASKGRKQEDSNNAGKK